MVTEILGKEAVIWRFDPLILTDNISVDTLIEKIERVGTEIHNCTEKLVFSFADIDSYKKVKANMTDSGIPYHEWNKENMEELAGKLTVLNRNRGWNLELATCGENLDLGKYRISRNRCIDGDLIARLAWKDKELMSALGVNIQEMPSPAFFDMNDLPYGAVLLPGNKYFVSNHKKDPGQRASCGCMAAKDIGEYNTCPHLCEYCYANSSKKSAIMNWEMHRQNPMAETITGK